MLSLMKGVFEPSISYPDKIMYMSSIGLNHSICSDNSSSVVENICNLLSSSSTKYVGLQVLEIALQQNSDIHVKSHWHPVLYETLRSSAAPIIKEQVCKILCLTIPFMAKDPSSYSASLQEFIKDLFPFLLEKIEENVEWTDAASKCVHVCLKTFPQSVICYQSQNHLMKIIIKRVSYCVSSLSLEVLADCFCEIPNCHRDANPCSYQERWKKQYLRTLRTMQCAVTACMSNITEDPYEESRKVKAEEYIFPEDDADKELFPAFAKHVRQFINLCKCLAKMLSTRSRCSVAVPIKLTLECFFPLYTLPDKTRITCVEQEIFYSSLVQMQIATLVVIESLILNCNLLRDTLLMTNIILYALRACKSIISVEPVSQLRLAVWKIMGIWLGVHGTKVASEIAKSSDAIDELLKDICIEVKESSQASSSVQAHHKSKKSISTSSGNKSILLRKNQQLVCQEALKTLEILLYSGAPYMTKEITQEINNKILHISNIINLSNNDSFPPPYDDDSCRKNLYSVLLAIVVNSKPGEVQAVQGAVGIFANNHKDPSFEVRNFRNMAMTICRLSLHPKRPSPVYSEEKLKRSQESNKNFKYSSEWSSHQYEEEAVSMQEAPESANTNMEEPFQNEVEVNSEGFMEVESHYSERTVKIPCNGEESEIQSSSQCQDEESEDEDEEDEEERSYGEEDNQEEILQEVYIPTPRKLQVLNPAQINPETVQTVVEPEYEELKPPSKTEPIIGSNNKNMHLNGVRSVVPADVQSSAQVSNENGIDGAEDDDLEEEEDDEEDEEETVQFPAEKKIENFEPPTKRPKIDEAKEELTDNKREENSRSPTLSEMKADFCCTEIEDVKS